MEQITDDWPVGGPSLETWLNQHNREGWVAQGSPTPVLVEGAGCLRYTFTR